MKIRIAGAVGLLALSSQAGVVAAGAPAAAPAVFHHPRIAATHSSPNIGNYGWASSNWSGYAATGSNFTSVTGSWRVPAVSASRGATYSSSWIGIDGFNNSNLIQTGTEQDYYNGSAHYGAWWEILPAAETTIPSLTIHPGDLMSADIHRVSGTTFSITLTDNTTGQSFNTTKTYNGQLTSVEWIQEAPTVGGHTATLASYGTVTFDPGTVNGGNPGLNFSESGIMVQKNHQVSTPSVPDGDTDGYTAAYGSSQPAPPSS